MNHYKHFGVSVAIRVIYVNRFRNMSQYSMTLSVNSIDIYDYKWPGYHFRIEWIAYDYHSGLDNIVWRLFDNFTDTDIIHAHEHIPAQGMANVCLLLQWKPIIILDFLRERLYESIKIMIFFSKNIDAFMHLNKHHAFIFHFDRTQLIVSPNMATVQGELTVMKPLSWVHITNISK